MNMGPSNLPNQAVQQHDGTDVSDVLKRRLLGRVWIVESISQGTAGRRSYAAWIGFP